MRALGIALLAVVGLIAGGCTNFFLQGGDLGSLLLALPFALIFLACAILIYRLAFK